MRDVDNSVLDANCQVCIKVPQTARKNMELQKCDSEQSAFEDKDKNTD